MQGRYRASCWAIARARAAALACAFASAWEVWGDMGRHRGDIREIWGDLGRYGASS